MSGTVGADGAPVPPPDPPNDPRGDRQHAREQHRERMNVELFRRELDEVHLLLDFISGRTDRSLDQLVVDNPDAEPGQTLPKLRPAEVLQRIVRLRYPPPLREEERAREAAFLLAVKDKLSELAYPARALTIAYTAMFSGIAPIDQSLAAGARAGRGDATFALATEAFPFLQDHVRRFRVVFRYITIPVTILILLVVALTYWDVAHGHAILQRIQQADQDRQTILTANATLDCAHARNAACDRLDGIGRRRANAEDDIRKYETFESSPWWHASLLRVALKYWSEVKIEGASCDSGSCELRHEFLATLLRVFDSYVLPVLFGILGAFVRIFRLLQEKIRDSLLGPRDLILILVGLPMGCVAGIAVGFFLQPSADGSLPTVAADFGKLSPTVIGLGFLAGYGAESFFSMLDALIRRVFNIEPANGKAASAAS